MSSEQDIAERLTIRLSVLSRRPSARVRTDSRGLMTAFKPTSEASVVFASFGDLRIALHSVIIYLQNGLKAEVCEGEGALEAPRLKVGQITGDYSAHTSNNLNIEMEG